MNELRSTKGNTRHSEFASAMFNELIGGDFTFEEQNEAITELVNKVIGYRQGAIDGFQISIKEIQESCRHPIFQGIIKPTNH